MKFYTPCNNLPFQSVYRVKGGTEMDGPNRLEELVNTYETTLYRAALAILGDAHEAEDAVQDAFLRCLEKAPDFESPAHARAWLLRVTVNGCKSRLRAPWRRRTAPLLDAYPAAAPEEGTLLEAMQALPARDRCSTSITMRATRPRRSPPSPACGRARCAPASPAPGPDCAKC